MLPNIVPDALGAFFLFVRSLHSTQESVAFSPSAMHFFRHHHLGRQTMQLHTFFTNKINLAFYYRKKSRLSYLATAFVGKIHLSPTTISRHRFAIKATNESCRQMQFDDRIACVFSVIKIQANFIDGQRNAR